MSARLLAACLISAALLGGNPARVAASSPEKSRGRLVTRTYQVADLVIPIGAAEGADVVTLGESLLGKGGESTPAAAGPERTCALLAVAERCPPQSSEGPAKLAAASKTLEDRLIKLIVGTVAPETWSEHGGVGTIDYYPLGMALVVNQTAEVQERVAELLASLRRLQDVQVAVELRFVTVLEKTFDRVAVDLGIEASAVDSSTNGPASPKVTYLDDGQVSGLFERVEGDRQTNVLQAPKLTLFNGQASTLTIADQQSFLTGIKVSWNGEEMVFTPQAEVIPLGLQMGIQPVVSADRRTVHINLNGTLTSLASDPDRHAVFDGRTKAEGTASAEPKTTHFTQSLQTPRIDKLCVNKTLHVPAGRTALLTGWKRECEVRNEKAVPVLSEVSYVGELFKNVCYDRETEWTMVLVTPRILVHEELEECAPTVCPFKAGEKDHANAGPSPAPAAGSVLENLERLDQARKVYARAEHYRKVGETDKAQRTYRRVEQSCPGSRYARLAAGRLAELSAGEAKGSEGTAEEAEMPAGVEDGEAATRSPEPHQAEVAELLAEYRDACSRGCLDAARSIAEKALALDPACFSKIK